MITETTTQVWVRVDAKSRRVIAVSDEPLAIVEGKPVFPIAANFARLDYYKVENNASATYGFIVRAATAEERSAADAAAATNAAFVTQRSRQAKVEDIRNLFANMFMNRFRATAFQNMKDVACAASYSGTDTNMVDNVKPLAIQIMNAGCEWKHNSCQPVLAGVLDGSITVEVDDNYRTTTEDALDTFLTEKGFDVATYHR